MGSIVSLTGVIATVALTAVLVLGIVVHGRRQLPGLSKSGTLRLHRFLSLLALGVLIVHVGESVLAPEAGIGLAAIVIPFAGSHQPLWIGLGALSLDLMVVLAATSVWRVQVGRRWWRPVHWLAYACWPAAMAHSIGIGPGMRTGDLLDLAIVCIAAVVGASAWRLAGALRQALTSRPSPAQRVWKLPSRSVR